MSQDFFRKLQHAVEHASAARNNSSRDETLVLDCLPNLIFHQLQQLDRPVPKDFADQPCAERTARRRVPMPGTSTVSPS